MLTLFPLQFLSFFAYSFLRITIGCIYIFLARQQLQNFEIISPKIHWPVFTKGSFVLTLFIVCEGIIGTLFLIGLFTQIAAILSIGLCFKIIIWHKRFPAGSIPERMTYLLLFIISVTLFITGAGALAFDLPI